jgi:hypothetical protein
MVVCILFCPSIVFLTLEEKRLWRVQPAQAGAEGEHERTRPKGHLSARLEHDDLSAVGRL